MELEREVRYKIDNKAWDIVLRHTEPFKPQIHTLDITFGAYGFESLAKTGRIFRIRQKGESISLEVKERSANNSWLEGKIKLESVKQGFEFLKISGLEPYLYLKRNREVRKYGNLKIFLDDFDLIGKFVEIEFQDSELKEVEKFLELCSISSAPQPLYGDIVKILLEKDNNFKREFERELNNYIK